VVKEKLGEKHRSFQHYVDTGSDYDKYAKCRNQAQWEVDKAKRAEEREIAEKAKSNPKAFFSHADSRMKTRSAVPDLRNADGSLTDSDFEKAQRLNQFFESVFTKENTTNLPSTEQITAKSVLSDIKISEEATRKKLLSLNPNKSAGPDQIPSKVLKEAGEELARPLTEIFNKSLEEQIVPEEWKKAQITPIYKKGDKREPGNYRPVSLTSTVCKVMESLVREELMKHLQPIMSEDQHGFQSGRSCTTQLLQTLDEWTKLLDSHQPVDAVYLDFAKAFDSVPHERLLLKLKAYGVEGRLLGWIRDFLTGRQQRVAIGGDVSEWRPVTSGVPQGSVLGPVLFLYYVNDMPDTVKSNIKMFADDAKISAPVSRKEEQKVLQEDLDSLQKWTDKWLLRFNTGKCKVLHMGYSNQKTQYFMGGENDRKVLQETKCEKDLGVYVDPSLNFSEHCQKVANKANRLVGIIRRSFRYLDGPMLKQLFIGLVRPHLEYANVVWAPQYKKDEKIIENVQRRATKLVPELKHLEYEQRLEALSLPSLSYRRRRGDLIETFKFRKDFYNVNKESLLPRKEYDKTRQHSQKLDKQSFYLDIRKKFFSNRVHDAWNALPSEIIESKTIETFKGRLDNLLRDLKYSTGCSLSVSGGGKV
jgi:hypothetical protein